LIFKSSVTFAVILTVLFIVVEFGIVAHGVHVRMENKRGNAN